MIIKSDVSKLMTPHLITVAEGQKAQIKRCQGGGNARALHFRSVSLALAHFVSHPDTNGLR